MPGSFVQRAPFEVPTVTSPFETTKVEPEEFSLERTRTSSAITSLTSESLHKHAYDGDLLIQPHGHFYEVIVSVNLLATNRMIELILNENDPLEKVLQVVRPKILTTYFESSGYFGPFPASTLEWTMDLTFGDLSLLNMINLLTYRGEPQETLLIKDVFYGGETLEPRIFQLTSLQDSGAPGPPVEFNGTPKPSNGSHNPPPERCY
ncbi:uncharacterized protein DFL_007952 [Arthrobotrys flagrans]|uniref:Uncharacterized protein n=1 Tax=Arthrobotrys flagrans TaxID=97331 RepID=A0A436ZX66_ARTFL|nr:hypothetical protein DFL_007952 [Arthrobotrys flagrans]